MSADNLKKKTAIYVRVSTQFQVDKESLQVQKRELVAYSNLVLGISDYEIFEDPGYSGKNTDRPAYQRMLAMLRTGEFSHLLVWKIDRISRNLLDFSEMYAELRRIGVTFVSKNEQFDTSTAIGEAMLKIILVFAELERKMTAERVTSVMLSRASNGQWNGGKIPLGYDWDSETKTFSINHAESKVYHRMVELYEEKQSLIEICNIMNDEGLRSKKGNLWTPTTASMILKNIFYTGTYRYNKSSIGKGIKEMDESEWIVIPNHHPALIDQERYERLVFLLDRNRRNGFKEGDTITMKHFHIFAGLVRCAKCGHNMVASQGRRRADGWRPTSYICSYRRNTGACTNKYVSDTYLATAVFELISVILAARNDIGHLDSYLDLEDRILKTVSFSSFAQVQGIEDMYLAIVSGETGMEYKPSKPTEKDDRILTIEKEQKEAEESMKRLQSLYLHGDSGLSEKDYLIERRKLLETLENKENELNEYIAKNMKLNEQDFLEKASYFMMVEHLLDFKPGKVSKVIRSIDPQVAKTFVNRILKRISIDDGEISEITFKNGVALKFIK